MPELANSAGTGSVVYWLKPQEGRGVPVSRATTPEQANLEVPRSGGQREENAQVEDPYGREEALQQDWHRQDQAGPGQDAPYPYVESAKDETQAGKNPAGFRWRLREGRAHDSLRLIAVPLQKETALQGPRERVARAPGKLEQFCSSRMPRDQGLK